jgi:nucleoside-diphosphate-sugar epimerase
MPQTILIDGATGFVAAHVVHAFLSAGYNVRATARNAASAAKVRATHGSYGDALSVVLVPDVETPGAYDEVVKGVDGVIHTASPVVLDAKDFERELFAPAVEGTLNVLRAVHRFGGPSVRRVVVTSSFASVLDLSKGLRPGYVYTEKDWNPMTADEAIASNDPVAAYLVSKTLAERAAHDFVAENRPSFDVTSLCPPMVYGPVAHSVASMDKLNVSAADFWRLMNGSEKSVPDTSFFGFADVRDLATAHRLAFEKKEAAGQRYLITNGPYTYQIFLDIIREKFPELRHVAVEGNPGQGLPDVYRLDNSKSIRELGLTYRSIEETVVDSVESLRALNQKLSK